MPSWQKTMPKPAARRSSERFGAPSMAGARWTIPPLVHPMKSVAQKIMCGKNQNFLIKATFYNKVPTFKLNSILSHEFIVYSNKSLKFTWNTPIFTHLTVSSQILTQETRKMFTRSLHIFLFCLQILHTILIDNIQINTSVHLH
jgi:hypothetical protein